MGTDWSRHTTFFYEMQVAAPAAAASAASVVAIAEWTAVSAADTIHAQELATQPQGPLIQRVR